MYTLMDCAMPGYARQALWLQVPSHFICANAVGVDHTGEEAVYVRSHC